MLRKILQQSTHCKKQKIHKFRERASIKRSVNERKKKKSHHIKTTDVRFYLFYFIFFLIVCCLSLSFLFFFLNVTAFQLFLFLFFFSRSISLIDPTDIHVEENKIMILQTKHLFLLSHSAFYPLFPSKNLA